MRCWWASGVLHIAGELRRDNASTLAAQLSAAAHGADFPLTLDLFELDLEDSVATVYAVNAVRGLRAFGPVIVRHAPQWMAHSLYRVNALSDGMLRLEAPREEEPYA